MHCWTSCSGGRQPYERRVTPASPWPVECGLRMQTSRDGWPSATPNRPNGVIPDGGTGSVAAPWANRGPLTKRKIKYA
jgi:hypothetical protein